MWSVMLSCTIDSFHAQRGNVVPSRRRRIPSRGIRAHVLYTLETLPFHVSVLLNISPRCFCVLTWGMGTPFIGTSGLCFAVLPIARCLLLGALKNMPHLSAHEAAVSRSELRRAQLDMLDLSAVCNVVSSAKIEHWLWVDSGRSLIKIRKSTGPRTVPCGTVHSVFSKTLFDFKKSISGLIELKFSGKTPNEVLYAPIYFWGVYF